MLGVRSILSDCDYRCILQTIEMIYSMPDHRSMFLALCAQLREYIGIYSAIFVPIDPHTGTFLFGNYEIYNNSEWAMLAYLAYYAPLDPFTTSGWFQDRSNEVARNTDLAPTLGQSEFACDFLLPLASVFYVTAATLRVQGDRLGMLGLHRQKHDGNFTDRDIAFVDALLPHIARFLHRDQFVGKVPLFTETKGAILLDESCHVLYMNEMARSALRGRSVTRIPDPGFGSEPAYFDNGVDRYRVRTLPISGKLKGRFIILELQSPEDHLSAKLTVFGLSIRERQIAGLVIKGLSNREIAERLFISELTVKDHLKNVFGKVAIRRRSELAHKVLNIS